MNGKKNLIIMITLIGILVLPISYTQLVNAQEGQVILSPTDDTYVYSGSPSSNYGGLSYLYLSNYTFVDIQNQELIWLKFNLSQVPDGAVIDAATLQVYASHLTETYTVYTHSSSNNSWTELTLIYSNLPSYNDTSMDSEIVSKAEQYYNWSVLDAVRNAADGVYGGSDVVTIVLTEHFSHGSISYVQFYAKEHEFGIPKLIVHWSDVVPEFPSFLILPLFMIVTLLAVIVLKREHQT